MRLIIVKLLSIPTWVQEPAETPAHLPGSLGCVACRVNTVDMTRGRAGVPKSNAHEEMFMFMRKHQSVTRQKQFLKGREARSFRTAMKTNIVSFSEPKEILSPL